MHEKTQEILDLINGVNIIPKDVIKTFLHMMDIERKNLEKDYKDDLEDMRTVIRAVRTKCKHEETEYYPDPSGNNDSCYVCLICGLEKKRFK